MEYNITYRKKDGGWQYIISTKEDGKWKYRTSKQGFRTRGLAKIAADDRLEELKEEYAADLSIENKGMTFGKFVSKYLKDMEKYREVNTIKAYRYTFNHFSSLNHTPVEDIEFLHIQECIDNMIEKGLKTSTIETHLRRIKTLFNKATKKPYKIIRESPIDEDIELPEEKEGNKKIRALTQSELEYLLGKMKPKKDYIICLLAATCGLRVGEILGITWNDIDEKNKKLTVNKQWKRQGDDSFGFGSVKHKTSNRIVPIPKNTLNELLRYKKNNPTDIHNRVILDINLATTSSRIKQKMATLGFDNSIHDLRHTYATSLVAKGLDFKTVAELLGHGVEQTIRTYSHFNDDMMQKAVATVDDIF